MALTFRFAPETCCICFRCVNLVCLKKQKINTKLLHGLLHYGNGPTWVYTSVNDVKGSLISHKLRDPILRVSPDDPSSRVQADNKQYNTETSQPLKQKKAGKCQYMVDPVGMTVVPHSKSYGLSVNHYLSHTHTSAHLNGSHCSLLHIKIDSIMLPQCKFLLKSFNLIQLKFRNCSCDIRS